MLAHHVPHYCNRRMVSEGMGVISPLVSNEANIYPYRENLTEYIPLP